MTIKIKTAQRRFLKKDEKIYCDIYLSLYNSIFLSLLNVFWNNNFKYLHNLRWKELNYPASVFIEINFYYLDISRTLWSMNVSIDLRKNLTWKPFSYEKYIRENHLNVSLKWNFVAWNPQLIKNSIEAWRWVIEKLINEVVDNFQ